MAIISSFKSCYSQSFMSISAGHILLHLALKAVETATVPTETENKIKKKVEKGLEKEHSGSEFLNILSS